MNSVELTSAHWDRMMTHESVSENSRLAEITPDRTGTAQFQTTLALDRTTLAWIRTTLTIATFGFGMIGPLENS